MGRLSWGVRDLDDVDEITGDPRLQALGMREEFARMVAGLLRHADDLVVSGSPHGRTPYGDACECDTCDAWRGIKRALDEARP